LSAITFSTSWQQPFFSSPFAPAQHVDFAPAVDALQHVADFAPVDEALQHDADFAPAAELQHAASVFVVVALACFAVSVFGASFLVFKSCAFTPEVILTATMTANPKNTFFIIFRLNL
jgi:hypothetical protein